MGTVEEHFEGLAKELSCSICLNTLAVPVCRLPCCHYFCRDCIHQSLKHKQQCPVCKSKVGRREIGDDSTMDRIITAFVDLESSKEQLLAPAPARDNTNNINNTHGDAEHQGLFWVEGIEDDEFKSPSASLLDVQDGDGVEEEVENIDAEGKDRLLEVAPIAGKGKEPADAAAVATTIRKQQQKVSSKKCRHTSVAGGGAAPKAAGNNNNKKQRKSIKGSGVSDLPPPSEKNEITKQQREATISPIIEAIATTDDNGPSPPPLSGGSGASDKENVVAKLNAIIRGLRDDDGNDDEKQEEEERVRRKNNKAIVLGGKKTSAATMLGMRRMPAGSSKETSVVPVPAAGVKRGRKSSNKTMDEDTTAAAVTTTTTITAAPKQDANRRIPARLQPWNCSICTFENHGAKHDCEMCGTSKGANELDAAATEVYARLEEGGNGNGNGNGGPSPPQSAGGRGSVRGGKKQGGLPKQQRKMSNRPGSVGMKNGKKDGGVAGGDGGSSTGKKRKSDGMMVGRGRVMDRA